MIFVFTLLILASAQDNALWPFRFEIEPRGLEVSFILQNTQRTPLTVLRWGTPLDKNAPFRADMFRIRGESEPVYAGVFLKRVVTAEDLVFLEPGQSVRGTVNLENGYWIRERGTYEALFVTSVLVYQGIASLRILESEDPLRDFTEYPLVSLESFTFESEGKANPPGWWDPPITAEVDPGIKPVILPPKTYNCNGTQTTLIHTATSSCKTYAYGAKNYLDLGYNPPAKRYTTWFGAYDLNRWNIVKSHFDKIKERTKLSSYEVDCYCDSQYIGAYAYVYSGVCCRVHVCSLFWAAPNTGTDSRAGTLIHELSHFNIVGDTNDHAYGQTACKNLAINNPDAAIHNADSHEYFAENNPFQT